MKNKLNFSKKSSVNIFMQKRYKEAIFYKEILKDMRVLEEIIF